MILDGKKKKKLMRIPKRISHPNSIVFAYQTVTLNPFLQDKPSDSS